MELVEIFPHDDEHDEDSYEDIKEPLKEILEWMKKGGELDVPRVNEVFAEAMILARKMEEVKDFYRACSNRNTACHKWHYKTKDGVLHVHSGTVMQKDI